MTTRPRVTMPTAIKANEVIEVRTSISHVMETGLRRDQDGAVVPRNIINSFRATFQGRDVFIAELHPSIAANPYIAFYLRPSGPGDLILIWSDDAGRSITERVEIRPT